MFSGGVDVASLQAGPQMGMMDANALASSSGNEIMGIINSINIAEIGISFIIYFIGGYMLYASIFAAIGSAVDSQEDTQQFMAPVTIFMIFALYAGIYSMENPDGPLAFWCSMIPFTSPIVMMVRIPFEIPFVGEAVICFLIICFCYRYCLVIRQDIPCRYPDVRQETEYQGNGEMD